MTILTLYGYIRRLIAIIRRYCGAQYSVFHTSEIFVMVFLLSIAVTAGVFANRMVGTVDKTCADIDYSAYKTVTGQTFSSGIPDIQKSDTVHIGKGADWIINSGGKYAAVFGVSNYRQYDGVWDVVNPNVYVREQRTVEGYKIGVWTGPAIVEFPDSSNGWVRATIRETVYDENTGRYVPISVSQRFVGLAYFNAETGEYTVIEPRIASMDNVVVCGNSITYKGIYDGTDLSYYYYDWQLKAELTIEEKARVQFHSPYPAEKTLLVVVTEVDNGVLMPYAKGAKNIEEAFGGKTSIDSTEIGFYAGTQEKFLFPSGWVFFRASEGGEAIEAFANEPERYRMKQIHFRSFEKNILCIGIPLSYIGDVDRHPGAMIFDPTVTWQSAASSGKDNSLKQDLSTLNYGTLTTLTAKGSSSNAVNHQLYQFDSLSVIPAGVKIDSAFFILTIYACGSGNSDSTLSLHIVTRAWTEGTGQGDAGVSNWDTASAGIKWTTAGGDYIAKKYATRKISAIKAQYDTVRFTVTTLIDTLVNDGLTNYGWLLKYDNDTYDMEVSTYSSDITTAAYRPKLVVYYTLPVYKPYNTSVTATSTRGFSITARDTTATRTKLYLITGGTKVDSVVNSGPGLYIWNTNYSNDSWTPSSTHTFFVSVTNGTDTAMSAAFSGTTLALFPPYNVSISGITDSSLTISATDSNKARKGLYLYRKDGAKLDSVLAPGSFGLYNYADTVSGYTPNKSDSFRVAVFDSLNPPTIVFQDGFVKEYTRAAEPNVLIADTSATFLSITRGSDGNPSTVNYAFYESSLSVYIDSTGRTSGTQVWIPYHTVQDTIILQFITPNKQYRLVPYASNSNGLITAGDTVAVWSWAYVPDVVSAFAHSRDSVRITIDPGLNPPYTFIAIEDSITGVFVDYAAHRLRSRGVTADSSWAWATYSEWGGANGYYIIVEPSRRYVFRAYAKEGIIRE